MKIFNLLYNRFFYRPYIKSKLKKAGSNFRLGYNSEILRPQYFEIGDNFFAGPYSYFGTNKNNPVFIGNNVMFGPSCKIIGGNHDYTFKENHMIFNKNIDHMKSEIIIEDGIWIGANSLIMSGARICEGTVIGALSLVNKYVPPYCIAVGIPVNRYNRRFQNKDDLETLLKNVNSKYSIDQINEIYKKFDLQYY